MDGIVTLAERHRRKREAKVATLPRLDAALAAYARGHRGRFIRFGSSATGRMGRDSDVDLLADFAGHLASASACAAAEALCSELGLLADARPLVWASDALVARALAEGVVLS